MSSGWKNILEGEQEKRARAVIGEIARALARHEGAPVDLAAGKAGMAIFFDYLARSGVEVIEDPRAISERLAGEAIDGVLSGASRSWFYHGFPGVAFALDHLARLRGETEHLEEDSVEDAVVRLLERPGWKSYDVIAGVVGLGVYALERFPRPRAARAIELAVLRLEEMAERTGDHVTWFISPESMAAEVRKDWPNGSYNAGLAHGVPCAIAFLAAAAARGIERARATELLEGAVAWLFAQRTAEGRFPGYVVPGEENVPLRLAWCYGEPGIAGALLAAAQALGREDWRREAHAIARAAIALPDRVAGVFDAGLCHGAAGLAHIYNRIHQATGDAALRDASRKWFENAFEYQRPERGIAGYQARGVSDGVVRYTDDPGIVTGAAGIGLALLSAIAPIEPAWDRALLLSLPEVA